MPNEPQKGIQIDLPHTELIVNMIVVTKMKKSSEGLVDVKKNSSVSVRELEAQLHQQVPWTIFTRRAGPNGTLSKPTEGETKHRMRDAGSPLGGLRD